MIKITNFLKSNTTKIPDAAALLGLLVYINRVWGFANTLASRIFDETHYMVIGHMLASGRYQAYQFYGPFLDHLPISFLIPGYAQLWFGPGLRTGRYLAMGLGILALIGYWIVARRWSNPWVAAGFVWAVALNTAWVKVFSIGTSQVLVNFFLAWSLVFALSRDVKPREIVIGAGLAGLVGMTRINMLPFVGFLILYIFWQHGKKAGLLAAAGGLGVVGLINLMFWPNILRIWTIVLPDSIFPFLTPYKSPAASSQPYFTLGELLRRADDPAGTLFKVKNAFWYGMRENFVSIWGVAATLLLWPKKKDWKSSQDLRATVFLLGVYFFLLLLHSWASLLGNICPHYCFSGYIMFFGILGLLAACIGLGSFKWRASRWYQVILVILTLLFAYGLLFSYRPVQVGQFFAEAKQSYKEFMNTPVPRIKELTIQPGEVPLWVILQNKFGLDYEYSFNNFENIYPFIISVLVILGVPTAVWWAGKRYKREIYSFGVMVVLAGWVLGTAFSPTVLLGGNFELYACSRNVFDIHEEIGAELAAMIPAESLVYWGNIAWTDYLYILDTETFPAQTLHPWNWTDDPEYDDEVLEKYGGWNQRLKVKWMGEADYIVFHEVDFDANPNQVPNLDNYRVTRINPDGECPNDRIDFVVLERVKGE